MTDTIDREMGSGLGMRTRVIYIVVVLLATAGLIGLVLSSGASDAGQPRIEAPAAAQDHHDHGSKAESATAGKKAVDLGVVSLDVYRDAAGRLHQLTARRDAAGGAARLEYRYSDDGGATWCSAVIVGEGQAPPGPVKRGADAQIVSAGDKLFAAWTTAGSLDRMGRGPIETALSSDSGRTWRAGPNPSDSGTAIGHAFIDLAADEKGAIHLVWLDGRDQPVPTTTPTKEEKRDANAPSPGKGLRYARSTDGGLTWSANQTLVEKTCECCWNTLVVGQLGRIGVLYRQHSPRDMAVVWSGDSGRTWQRPVTVGTFDWNVNACPHVGGSLVFDGACTSYATVWTARGNGATGAFLLTSTSADSRFAFSEPVQIGKDAASWHTDIAIIQKEEGSSPLAVTWDAYAATGSAVFAMTSPDGGKTWSPPKQLSTKGVSATHPRVIRAGDDSFRAYWTAKSTPDAPATWESAELPI
jgi:hypothetical protein